MVLIKKYPNALAMALADVKEEIESCIVIREEDDLRDSCKNECSFYEICRMAYPEEDGGEI
jgi:hypothetical protein